MYITSEDENNYREMEDIFLKTNTDKSSKFHDYTRTYSKLFKPIKNHSLKFLEIGICFGDSVKAWEEYFPNAQFHFIDICLTLATYHSSRSKYHLADQKNTKDLQEFINEVGGDFDIIIDDGDHGNLAQLTSFNALFPCLNKGGIYVIEDIHWSTKSPSPPSTFDFLKSLIDDINAKGFIKYKGTDSCSGGHLNVGLTPNNFLQDQIDSMIIKNGLAIITRRQF